MNVKHVDDLQINRIDNPCTDGICNTPRDLDDFDNGDVDEEYDHIHDLTPIEVLDKDLQTTIFMWLTFSDIIAIMAF